MSYSDFCPDFLGHVRKRVDKKAKVSFKIYYVTNWETITIPILPNISRFKGNQTMKLGQLIEYNIATIFLQTSCRKLGRETSQWLVAT